MPLKSIGCGPNDSLRNNEPKCVQGSFWPFDFMENLCAYAFGNPPIK